MDEWLGYVRASICLLINAPVAQLDRASAFKRTLGVHLGAFTGNCPFQGNL